MLEKFTSIERIPKTYRLQDGCWNCVSCYGYFPSPDEGPRFTCTFGAEQRPQSALFPCNFEQHMKLLEKIDEWEHGRIVAPYGWCNQWKKKDTKQQESCMTYDMRKLKCPNCGHETESGKAARVIPITIDDKFFCPKCYIDFLKKNITLLETKQWICFMEKKILAKVFLISGTASFALIIPCILAVIINSAYEVMFRFALYVSLAIALMASISLGERETNN